MPLFQSLLPSFRLLRRNDPLRLAGATAFFTTFALAPIVFLLAQLFGLIFSPRMVGRGLIQNLSNNLGPEGATQVREVIRSIRGFNDSWYVIVLGFIFLFFVSTTLFGVIESSINQLWETAARKRSGISLELLNRFKAFAVIVLVGLLFFADLLFKGIESWSGDQLENVFGSSVYYRLVFSEVTGVVVVSAWFIILFRYISSGRPSWRAAIIGGVLTGVLFSIGRYILRHLLINGNVGKLYGTSGSLVLVLLFVFYTSFILYFGACFVRVWTEQRGERIVC